MKKFILISLMLLVYVCAMAQAIDTHIPKDYKDCIKQLVPVIEIDNELTQKRHAKTDSLLEIPGDALLKFVAMPAFDGRSCLYCPKGSNELVARKEAAIPGHATLSFKMTVSDAVIDTLHHLLRTIAETQYPPNIGIDGIFYWYAADCGDEAYVERDTWCPMGKLGRASTLLEFMWNAVEFADEWAVESLVEEMARVYYDRPSLAKDSMDWYKYFLTKRTARNQDYYEYADAVAKKIGEGQKVTIEEVIAAMPQTRDEVLVIWGWRDFNRDNQGELIAEAAEEYAMENPHPELLSKFFAAAYQACEASGFIEGTFWEYCFSLWQKYPKETAPYAKDFEESFRREMEIISRLPSNEFEE